MHNLVPTRSLWIDIWASLPRSDVDGIEQADILDLPPECARPPAEPVVEGKERGEKEGEMKGGRRVPHVPPH